MKNKFDSLTRDKTLKAILIACCPAILIFLVFNILYHVYYHGKMTKNEITFIVKTTADVFQILFFIVIASVTILSYIQARKTLFTPIKTETFKMQIKAFEDILAFFQNKTETDFARQFDIDFIVSANAQLLLNDYVELFFKIKINSDVLQELNKNFIGAVASLSFAEKHFQSPEYFERTKPKEEIEITSPAQIFEKWKIYEYGLIHYSKVFSEEMNKLTKIIASPLLPVELKNKLTEFEKTVNDNLFLIGSILTKISQEFPQKFPNAKSIYNFEMAGIENKYNREKKDLQPIAAEILVYIRHYLKIDNLVDV